MTLTKGAGLGDSTISSPFHSMPPTATAIVIGMINAWRLATASMGEAFGLVLCALGYRLIEGTITHQLAEVSISHSSAVVTIIEIWPSMVLDTAMATSLAMQLVSHGEHMTGQPPSGNRVYPAASVT